MEVTPMAGKKKRRLTKLPTKHVVKHLFHKDVIEHAKSVAHEKNRKKA